MTLNIAGSAKLLAGAKVQATPASVKIQGGTVGGDGAEIKVSGTVHYK